MMGKFLAVLSLSMLFINVQCQHVHRRSDDPDPLEVIVQQQGQTIASLQSQLTALQASVEANTQHRTKAVAFTVRFSQSPVQVAPQGILRFDVVPVNIGNGYSTHSGIFTAPYSGLYLFILNIMITNDDSNLQIAIDKSGTTLAVTHADSHASDRWDKGMTHVTVHLNAGEEVWVRHNDGDTNLYGDWWTTFTCCLLHAD